jgi:hypothetical protein
VLVALALLVGDPRGYEGPSAAPSGEAQVDPFAATAPREEVDVDALARELPALRAAPAPPEPAVRRPHAGRGMLIVGGIAAGTGLALTSLGTLSFVMPMLFAPAPWLVSVGLLGGGMHRRSYDAAARRVDEEGRDVKPPRRGVFGAGVAMAVIGSGAIVATWPIGFLGAYVQWAAGPLAIAGAMMAGGARGRKLGRRPRVTAMPIVTRSSALLSITGRW